MDLFRLAEDLYQYLINAGVEFSEEGYPIITEEMLLKEIPDQILPIGQEYAAKDKSKVLLVTFCNDKDIYRVLFSLKKDIPKYKEYLGIGGFDLSPRINWDIALQKFNILLNMMANVFLALNGVKIMPNFRIGCIETISVLQCYPKNTWFLVGALGCARGRIKLNELYLRAKLLITNPNMLVYYGKLKPEYTAILEDFGVDYRIFADFQRVSRGKEMA